jgi:hypothetical protein
LPDCVASALCMCCFTSVTLTSQQKFVTLVTGGRWCPPIPTASL